MNKKNIIIIVTLLFISSIIGIYIYLKINKNDINNTNDNLKNPVEISDTRLKELFDNSYKYYLIYQGRDANYDQVGYIYIEGVKYYKSKVINSFDNIKQLVDNTFSEKRRITYYQQIFETRDYIETENALYGNFNNYCNNIPIEFEELEITNTSKFIIYIKSKNIGVHAYYENNNWYLDAPLHFCE